MTTTMSLLPSGFYALSWPERLRALTQAGLLTPDDSARLGAGQALLRVDAADHMVENVVGVMGLPLAVATGMVVDGHSYITPMVVEEPSIVAALSAAAKVVGRCGGFTTSMQESLLAGQIQITGVDDGAQAAARIMAAQEEIVARGRALQPAMVARGGGVQDVTVTVAGEGAETMVIVHLWVDTQDAMGANAVNTLCEALAQQVATIAGGEPGLRILSNLCSRSLVTVRCVLPPEALAHKQLAGDFVKDRIMAASRMAELDAFRAATHNKGIMNGIDGLAVATGNDWRAIEAGAHAWAGRGAGYAPLSRWSQDAGGNLVGELCMPLKVGIVGGNFLANPTVALALRLVQVPSAQALARLMAAVGLAQNFAALKALGTVGIQSGHMTLHARSVVASAGAGPEHFAAAVKLLLQSGDIKLERAQRIVAELEKNAAEAVAASAPSAQTVPPSAVAQKLAWGQGFGKLIVLGEHAVVYNSHALAVPLTLATEVSIGPRKESGVRVHIPAWQVESVMPAQGSPKERHHRLFESIRLMVRELHLEGESFDMTVYAHVPRAMGLGSSAALVVATVRALSAYFNLDLSERAVIALAFQSEKLAHGTPSGVDNALATLGAPLLFRRGTPEPILKRQAVGTKLYWLVGLTHEESLTATTVSAVREAHAGQPALYDAIFSHINDLTEQAAAAMATGDVPVLGQLMNINHGLLHALEVSTLQLEQLVMLAKRHGALGAKVTGGGGGGSMLALCTDAVMQKHMAKAFEQAGFRALCATTEVTHG